MGDTNNDIGEEDAVKTTAFEIGKTDGSYTVVLKGDLVNKNFIYKSDHPPHFLFALDIIIPPWSSLEIFVISTVYSKGGL